MYQLNAENRMFSDAENGYYTPIFNEKDSLVKNLFAYGIATKTFFRDSTPGFYELFARETAYKLYERTGIKFDHRSILQQLLNYFHSPQKIREVYRSSNLSKEGNLIFDEMIDEIIENSKKEKIKTEEALLKCTAYDKNMTISHR
jgi:hypothetical protein